MVSVPHRRPSAGATMLWLESQKHHVTGLIYHLEEIWQLFHSHIMTIPQHDHRDHSTSTISHSQEPFDLNLNLQRPGQIKEYLDPTMPDKEAGRSRKQDVKNLVSKPSVNEEYKEGFRTKSCGQTQDNIQCQLEIKTVLDEQQFVSPNLSPFLVRRVHLSDYFLDCHKTPTSIQESMNPYIFSDYFEISLKACKFCEFLLKNIHQVRINYHEIKNMLEQIRGVPNGSSWTDNEYLQVHEFLTSFASQMNPFSMVKPEEFHELNSCHKLLYQELRSRCNKTKRRNKQTRCIKLVKATFKVVGCGAFAIALIVLATHSITGPMAIIACFLCVSIIKKLKRRLNKTQLERLHAQLDVSSKGVYVLINDFDTICQLAMICDYEMEHMKMMAEISVRKGRNEVFKEVFNELQMQESCFLEHLEELEKHTYLSILDITRSRAKLCGNE